MYVDLIFVNSISDHDRFTIYPGKTLDKSRTKSGKNGKLIASTELFISYTNFI
jgi:hypothetical protein